MCMSHSSSQNVCFFFLIVTTSGYAHSVSFTCFSILQAKSATSLVFFFFSLHIWEKTDHSYEEAWTAITIYSVMLMVLFITAPASTADSLTLSKSSQFPAFRRFCQNIMLPHFDPRYQQPSSFWEEGMISHQVNILRDDRRQKEYFHFILFGFVKFRLSDWGDGEKPLTSLETDSRETFFWLRLLAIFFQCTHSHLSFGMELEWPWTSQRRFSVFFHVIFFQSICNAWPPSAPHNRLNDTLSVFPL